VTDFFGEPLNLSEDFADGAGQPVSSPGGGGSTDENKPWYDQLWEAAEPERTAIESVLAPFDIVAGDHWVDALKEVAGQPAEWLGDLDKGIVAATKAMETSDGAFEKLIKVANDAERVGGKLDAFDAFSPGWLKMAAGNISEIRGLSNTLSGLGMLADMGTIISPEDSGWLGNFDRGVAGVNGVLLGINMCVDEFPVVGEVTIAATGIYLAGDFIYHHWNDITDAADDVGHWVSSGWDHMTNDAGNWVSSGWHDMTSWL
jgi:hypothetical protein